VTLSKLFNILDLDNNGELSRLELHESAQRHRWHWKEAPVLAVLDLLTILKPISKNDFIAYMHQIAEDPHGPYGNVLLNSAHFVSATTLKRSINLKHHSKTLDEQAGDDIVRLLKHTAGIDIANSYKNLLNNIVHNQLKIPMDHAALLIIDLQRSFTKGVWMKSIGSNAEREVSPIRLAFEKCAKLLNDSYRCIETMFTRCPFPSDSYHWDDRFTDIIDSKQLYFIKPGNSVLFPSTNGFRGWVESFINDGRKILVMGGCTLNSCVRVSSIETQKYFQDARLQVVVDLSLSGARTSNFIPSSLYGGLSAVESAVREMNREGVWVAQGVRWV
jgi:nicotinamidase-related amidase